MDTRDQINALESRQLELQAIMASSDAHAAKCTKLGLDFGETYPEELLAYSAAREEYNANEVILAELYRQLEEEERQETESVPIVVEETSATPTPKRSRKK